MPKRFYLELTEAQRTELERVRKSHAKPYLRERASAVLKVSDGHSMNWVAENGLLKRHEPETLKGWITRYLEQGLKGWDIQTGRGRKSVFFPSQQPPSPKRD